MAEIHEEVIGKAAAGGNDLAGKYLTFRLADEEYGLPIMKVQEIIGMMAVTKVPQVPDFVRGIINLRGRIHPTIDLRRKFNLDGSDDTEKTCIIVVEVESHQRKVNMGIIVDEVAEVLDIKVSEIDTTPDFGASISTEFILGLGVVKGAVKMLLDIDKILSTAETHVLDGLAQ